MLKKIEPTSQLLMPLLTLLREGRVRLVKRRPVLSRVRQWRCNASLPHRANQWTRSLACLLQPFVHSDDEAAENPDLELAQPKRISARRLALRAEAKTARQMLCHMPCNQECEFCVAALRAPEAAPPQTRSTRSS